MLTFEHSSLIHAPVEEVFAFHELPDAIERLTPPGQPAQVVERSGGLEVGSWVILRVWFGPVPRRWVAHHIAYEKNRLFRDEQREGPFRAWVHSHVFEATSEGQTRLTDSITYEPPLAGIVEPLFGWALERQLRSMFEYRHRVTKDYCETRHILSTP